MTTEQTALPAPVEVTGPGVYNLPAAEYHARPELSSTGARALLSPSCPALFKHEQDNPGPTRKVWEIGSAAHKLVLGIGPKLVLVDRPRWDTNEVKAQLADIRAAGNIPLKLAEYEQVHAMAAQLREHPWASKLFEPGTGQPEQTLIWHEWGHYTEDSTDVGHAYVRLPKRIDCRALVDWLPHPTGGRMIVRDYKTAVSAAPVKAAKAMAEHGYHIQLRFHLRGMQALGQAGDDAQCLLVVQEKTAPYLVTVIQPDRAAMRMADIRIREALDTYAQCIATGRWAGYSDDVVLAELPPWETRELEGVVW